MIQDLHNNSFAYVLILPSILLIAAIVVYPIYYVAEFSLYRSIAFTRTEFVGLENYGDLLDERTLGNAFASLVFVGGSIIIAVGLGLVLAVALNGKIAMRTTIRTIVFIPWVTSQIASALVWRWLVNPDYGPLVHVVQQLGGPRVDVLGDATLAMAILIFTNVWRSIAFSMIVLLAALQAIPESVLRSAEIDGAGAWRTFRDVVFPMILPSVLVCVIMSSFSYFNIITIPLVLTGGGPQSATELITLRMYTEAFSFFNIGLASAITMVILLMNILLTFVYLKLPGATRLTQ